MSSKNDSETMFECIKCKKFDRGDQKILKGYCYLCRVHELKTRYTKRKLENYNKFELKQELKRGMNLLIQKNIAMSCPVVTIWRMRTSFQLVYPKNRKK